MTRLRLRAVSRCLVGVAITAAVALTGWAGSASAASSSTEQAAFQAIVNAHYQNVGGNEQPAWGSPVVHTATGDMALLWRCYPGSSGSAQATVYQFKGGGWKAIAQIHPIPTPCVDDQPIGNAQKTGFSPTPERLTGATDFVVVANDANGDTLSVVSDVGGQWHAVPFEQPNIPVADRTILPVSYDPISQLVSASRITSATNLCNPCSAGNFGDYSTYSFDRAAGVFEPVSSALELPTITSPLAPVLGLGRMQAATGTPFTHALAYFAAATLPLTPVPTSDFTARVTWGDGTSSPASVVVVTIHGKVHKPPARKGLVFAVTGEHTYAKAGTVIASVQVTGPGGHTLGPVSDNIVVWTANPIARFSQSPGTPVAQQIDLLIPASVSSVQRPITSRIWTFGDGSRKVTDSTSSHANYMSVLHGLEQHPGDRSQWQKAADLGILPDLSGSEDYAQHLSSKLVKSIATTWLTYFPQHIIPHIYPAFGVYPVSLTITDNENKTSKFSHSVGVQAPCASLQGPLDIIQSACSVQTAVDALTSPPHRAPDYIAYTLSFGGGPASGSATVTIARDGSVFVAPGAAAVFGTGDLGAPSFTLSEALGYVNLNYLPRSAVSNTTIDHFIDGWTEPTTGYGAFGGGAGVTLIWSPSVNEYAQEVAAYVGKGAGVSLGWSCAVDIGKPKDLASLIPTNEHHKDPLSGASKQLKKDLGALMSEANALVSQSGTCLKLPPPSILGVWLPTPTPSPTPTPTPTPTPSPTPTPTPTPSPSPSPSPTPTPSPSPTPTPTPSPTCITTPCTAGSTGVAVAVAQVKVVTATSRITTVGNTKTSYLSITLHVDNSSSSDITFGSFSGLPMAIIGSNHVSTNWITYITFAPVSSESDGRSCFAGTSGYTVLPGENLTLPYDYCFPLSRGTIVFPILQVVVATQPFTLNVSPAAPPPTTTTTTTTVPVPLTPTTGQSQTPSG